MSPSEFLRIHQQNMRDDLPCDDLPFYQWLKCCEDPPGKFVPAIQLFYAGHELKGCFTPEEISVYRNLHHLFWTVKYHLEEKTA